MYMYTQTGAWGVDSGSQPHLQGDVGLLTLQAGTRYAISTKFDQTWNVTDLKEYVIQYEVCQDFFYVIFIKFALMS